MVLSLKKPMEKIEEDKRREGRGERKRGRKGKIPNKTIKQRNTPQRAGTPKASSV